MSMPMYVLLDTKVLFGIGYVYPMSLALAPRGLPPGWGLECK